MRHLNGLLCLFVAALAAGAVVAADPDPKIRFLNILQPEQAAIMLNRRTDDRELAANIIKRTVAVRGGGHTFFYIGDPFPPGMYYGIASAARFLAKWEDYFHDFDPLFAGPKLDNIVKLTPKPADLVLLRKDGKALLVVFADAHEKHPDIVTYTVTPAGGKPTIMKLGPAEFDALEITLKWPRLKAAALGMP